MRFAAAASFALVLLAGNTGCCLFCRPLFPCLHRHYHNDDCCGMGCQRQPIFNWGHCCDPCDHCGDWAGQSIIARTGNAQEVVYSGDARPRAKAQMASRVVPGSYREVTRVRPSQDEEVAEEEVIEEEPEVVAEAPRAKRVRSSKPRSHGQVVRVQRVE